jgi:hypothetical protein
VPNPLLARFERTRLEIEHAKILAKALQENPDARMPAETGRLPGDAQALPGIPAIGGRGSIGGAIRGTVPHIDGLGD